MPFKVRPGGIAGILSLKLPWHRPRVRKLKLKSNLTSGSHPRGGLHQWRASHRVEPRTYGSRVNRLTDSVIRPRLQLTLKSYYIVACDRNALCYVVVLIIYWLTNLFNWFIFDHIYFLIDLFDRPVDWFLSHLLTDWLISAICMFCVGSVQFLHTVFDIVHNVMEIANRIVVFSLVSFLTIFQFYLPWIMNLHWFGSRFLFGLCFCRCILVVELLVNACSFWDVLVIVFGWGNRTLNSHWLIDWSFDENADIKS